MFEKAHLRLILILTSVINKLASMAAHICISIAFSLSPKKYFNGKFCLSCLKKLCKALHKLFYGKHIVMQSWSKICTVNQCLTNKLYTTTLHNNITVEGLSTNLADLDSFPNHVSLPFQEQGPNMLFQVLPASA
jgi:hypothetical protein